MRATEGPNAFAVNPARRHAYRQSCRKERQGRGGSESERKRGEGERRAEGVRRGSSDNPAPSQTPLCHLLTLLPCDPRLFLTNAGHILYYSAQPTVDEQTLHTHAPQPLNPEPSTLDPPPLTAQSNTVRLVHSERPTKSRMITRQSKTVLERIDKNASSIAMQLDTWKYTPPRPAGTRSCRLHRLAAPSCRTAAAARTQPAPAYASAVSDWGGLKCRRRSPRRRGQRFRRRSWAPPRAFQAWSPAPRSWHTHIYPPLPKPRRLGTR
eukprot:3938579-Rhodomonas_salina.1